MAVRKLQNQNCTIAFLCNHPKLLAPDKQQSKPFLSLSPKHDTQIIVGWEPMEAYKQLVQSKTVRAKHLEEPQKDKLLQTKLREKEIKEALKEQKQAEKDGKEEERLENAAANRFERAFNHTSKRYEKEVREAHKKEEHKETGFMCEHGVWRCRICQPITKHK
ncbi:hypothetical protein OEZ85_005139 [Tetradesmus obliquus]|uniref:Remorin C-terminal domain-containing protein n=1 Tax=Tetradesmus obliquus TaxID=3088 RepID=A0ABY8UKL4_TETOB|nr:hypothetical protein OEZ85_005139 [Tetradesmus obliquus]